MIAEEAFKTILQELGEETSREGLRETPKRYIKFMKEFLSPPNFNFTTFDAEGTDEMIIQSNIPFYSLCEHHTAPFFGTAAIAYIPRDKIVGLSKLARTLEAISEPRKDNDSDSRTHTRGARSNRGCGINQSSTSMHGNARSEEA